MQSQGQGGAQSASHKEKRKEKISGKFGACFLQQTTPGTSRTPTRRLPAFTEFNKNPRQFQAFSRNFSIF
jgi:hypothetical protein